MRNIFRRKPKIKVKSGGIEQIIVWHLNKSSPRCLFKLIDEIKEEEKAGEGAVREAINRLLNAKIIELHNGWLNINPDYTMETY